MSAFLTDTLVWTGALLALVLLIRRPVAALFGPKMAYALWALPMARLLLPPLVLPAWMAPAAEPALEPVAAVASDDALMAMVADGSHTLVSAELAPEPSLLDSVLAFDWASVLLPVWLIGAGVFLVRRYALYFKMRRELLEAARPMGEAGRVRLVETPAADGPVAFGVIDKVIALPMGFMAGHDRAARDLALAHELAHHRGRDLICNMLVQPLFALHWFNPLSVLGWRALRRDQEAACDARVMHQQPREHRAAYAEVITRFATEPRHAARLALAAPMACPVLGDRSIVHRLKSLSMTDISDRRRWSARLLIGAAVISLPFTGSISYAQSEPVTPPAPPAPPAAPAAVEAPLPPVAPVAPEAREAPRVTVSDDGKVRIVRIERREGDKAEDGKKRVERRVVIRNGTPLHHGRRMSAEERAEFEQEMAELRKELHEEFGEHGEFQRELQRELQHELGEGSEFQKEMREKFGANSEFRREMRVAVANAHATARASAPRVTVRCRDGQREVTETVTSEDGRQHIFVCNAIAMADARKAIAAARADIAEARADVKRAQGMGERERAEALRSLEKAEKELRAD